MRSRPLHHMLVEIEATTACTRDCSFCRPGLLPEDVANPPWLSRANHTKVIMELADAWFKQWVVYCGNGESLMHPDFGYFLEETRRMLPAAKIELTTNGDLLRADWLRRYGHCLDSVCWDCYDVGPTCHSVPVAVKESGFDPKKVAVIDWAGGKGFNPISRAGCVFKTDKAAAQRQAMCGHPLRKVFYSAKGQYSLCCNDSHRRMARTCTLQEWLVDPEYTQARVDLLSGYREPYPQCLECEFTGVPLIWPANGLSAFYPTIDQTRYWLCS